MSIPFTSRTCYWEPLEKKEAIRLYNKEFHTIGEVAEMFRCTREHVERMLKAEGQLLEQ